MLTSSVSNFTVDVNVSWLVLLITHCSQHGTIYLFFTVSCPATTDLYDSISPWPTIPTFKDCNFNTIASLGYIVYLQ